MKYTVLKCFIPQIEKKLQSFLKESNKCGKGDFTYSVGEPRNEKRTTSEGKKVLVEVVDIDISGSYKVGDFEFVASLEYVPEVGKNIVKKAPGTEDIPEMYYTRTACDHCKSDRFRKYTILLKNKESGEYVQVGKSCVKAYIGYEVSDYVSYLSMFDAIEDYIGMLNQERIPHGEYSFSLDYILEQAVARKNECGYTSNKTIQDWVDKNVGKDETDFYCPLSTTASDVRTIVHKVTNGSDEYIIPEYKVSDAEKKEVAAIKDFIANLTENSDYVHNLKTILESGTVSSYNIGLAVSMVGYYLKENATPKEEKETIASEYVGNVGDKITFTATPVCVFSCESVYGLMHIYKFTVDNNCLVWKTNKCLMADKEVTVSATIKAHSEYRGTKQTEITRARVA